MAVEPELILSRPRGLIAARAGVLTLATLLALAFDRGGSAAGREVAWPSPLGFLAVLGLAYVTTALALVAARRAVGRRLVLAIFLLDVPLVTALVHLTGGVESQFAVLYLFLILVAGIVLADRVGVVVGAASAAAYGGLLFAEARGWIAAVGYGGADPRALRFGGADLARVGLGLAVLPAMGALAGACGRLLSERHLALQAAKRKLARAHLDTSFVLSQLGSGLLSLDEDGRILHFNRAAGEILGLDTAAVVTRPLAALGSRAEPLIHWIEAARRGEVPLARQQVEVRAADGRAVPLGMTGSRAGRSGLIVLFQDLTAARREEAERARKEKLAAIGGLVAGITHEIRNCVKPISGSLDVLEQEIALDSQNRRLAAIAARECRRLGRFVQALLDYGRVTPLVLDPVDLEGLLREVGEMAAVEGGGRVTVEVEVGEGATGLTALADREPMKQVLLNLTQNAIEAMGEGGGRLRLVLAREGGAEAPRAVLRVADSGPGVPEELRARIFEPFFTTKPGGTGFGLAIAAGIVERHGGAIALASGQDGGGACFEVHLPERIASLELASARAAAG